MTKRRAGVAFKFFRKLNVPYYRFHDVDVSPEGASLQEYGSNFVHTVEVLAEKRQQGGVKLPWGTVGCFTSPRYGADAATDPDPRVFNQATTQIITVVNVIHQLGDENYIPWGGREGYETPLNTDLRQEHKQIGRFIQLVVEHKHRTGFKGALLIEPKPQKPAKHQYDYDASTVYDFLKQFGLERGIKLNVEVSHAMLAGHSFHHEIATAIALGLFGSVDANHDDPRLGRDADQFPNSIGENALMTYEILKAGGFATGGLNFGAKVRRQNTDEYDLSYGHIGAMDTMVPSLEVAAWMIEGGELDKCMARHYAGQNGELEQQILNGQMVLNDITQYATQHQLAPQYHSGQQEQLENLVSHYLFNKQSCDDTRHDRHRSQDALFAPRLAVARVQEEVVCISASIWEHRASKPFC